MDTAIDFSLGAQTGTFVLLEVHVHSKMSMTRLILVNYAHLWIHSRWQHDGMIAAASRIMAEILTVSRKSYHHI